MSEFCSLCQTTETEPYCPRHGVVHRPFALAGRYDLDELIGAGGTSFVFGGRGRTPPDAVAVKILRPHVAQGSDAQERFLHQADAACEIKHENIVGIVDFGWDAALEVTYLVMERLSGQPADAMVRRSGPLAWAQVVPVLRQIRRAVAAAHGLGIHDGRLTAKNVFLVPGAHELTVKLCDFGFSTGTDRSEPRDDIYGIGTVAYELLTGREPLEGKDATGTLSDDPIRMNERLPALALPDWLDDLVRACRLRDPMQRPSLDEIETALAAPGGSRASGPAEAAHSGSGEASPAPATDSASTAAAVANQLDHTVAAVVDAPQAGIDDAHVAAGAQAGVDKAAVATSALAEVDRVGVAGADQAPAGVDAPLGADRAPAGVDETGGAAAVDAAGDHAGVAAGPQIGVDEPGAGGSAHAGQRETAHSEAERDPATTSQTLRAVGQSKGRLRRVALLLGGCALVLTSIIVLGLSRSAVEDSHRHVAPAAPSGAQDRDSRSPTTAGLAPSSAAVEAAQESASTPAESATPSGGDSAARKPSADGTLPADKRPVDGKLPADSTPPADRKLPSDDKVQVNNKPPVKRKVPAGNKPAANNKSPVDKQPTTKQRHTDKPPEKKDVLIVDPFANGN
jgi:Protein kinase domain